MPLPGSGHAQLRRSTGCVWPACRPGTVPKHTLCAQQGLDVAQAPATALCQNLQSIARVPGQEQSWTARRAQGLPSRSRQGRTAGCRPAACWQRIHAQPHHFPRSRSASRPAHCQDPAAGGWSQICSWSVHVVQAGLKPATLSTRRPHCLVFWQDRQRWAGASAFVTQDTCAGREGICMLTC